jgi:hypothetical protein
MAANYAVTSGRANPVINVTTPGGSLSDTHSCLSIQDPHSCLSVQDRTTEHNWNQPSQSEERKLPNKKPPPTKWTKKSKTEPKSVRPFQNASRSGSRASRWSSAKHLGNPVIHAFPHATRWGNRASRWASYIDAGDPVFDALFNFGTIENLNRLTLGPTWGSKKPRSSSRSATTSLISTSTPAEDV